MNLALLSRISRAIASTQDTTVLLKTIIAELQPVFDFHDVGLFVVNEAEDYHIDLVAETPEISPSEWNYSLFEQQIHRIPHQDSVTVWMMQQIIAAGQPVLFDFQDLMTRFPNYPQWAAMQSLGYRDCLATVLRVRGEVIGMFCLNALQKDHFSPEQFALFQAIADQVAITLRNILAQEEVLAQKQRVEQLLTISEAITQIKDRKQLLKTIYERIRPIFSYDNCGLFVLTEDGQYHYELIDAEIMDHEPAQVAIEQQYGAHHRYLHTGSNVEAWMQQGPGLFLLKDYMNHEQADLAYQTGWRQFIAGPLSYGGEDIGMLCFVSKQEDFYTEQHLPLFTAIAEQLSVAVSNVLANEEVLAEKAKVERLHFVSEVMSSIQRREQLTLAFDRIRSVFPFDNAGLFVLTEDGQQHYELLDSETLGQDLTQRRVEARFGKYARYPHPGSPIEWMMQTGEVGLYDFPDLLHRFPDYPQAEIMNKTNLRQIMAAPLRQGSEVIGLLNFNSAQADQYREADFSFFQAIAEQMSTVVSNILANEDIQRRERDKHLQVQAIHALNQSFPWPDKLQQVIRLLQVHLDIHLVIFAIHPEGQDNFCYAFERVGADEYRVFDYPGFLRFTGMSEADYHQPGSAYDQVVLATDEAFEQLKQENPAMRTTATRFGVRSWLHVPLQIGMAGQFRLGILSRHPRAYREADLQRVRTLLPSLELALSRSLAFEQVALLNEQLQQEKSYLQEEINTTYNFENFIGQSEAMQNVFRRIRQVAPTDSNVLIQGETGTGKELIARAIHSQSARQEKPLVKVNCAALPEHLIESELFGHVKGAFTGAVQSRVGKFELAHQGTIFLDEIGELPLALQAKLLRVLQEREFEKLGSNQVVHSDFRVIAATNRSLEEEAGRGAFRLDLLYRLNSFPLRIPPLGERREDIPLLADHFARLYTQKLNKPFRGFTKASQDRFRQYDWPGNVRELQNVIEQASIVAQAPLLDITAQPSPSVVSRPSDSGVRPDTVDMHYIKVQQDALERQYLLEVLEKTRWKVSGEGGAAAQLKLKPTTLEYRMKKLGIER